MSRARLFLITPQTLDLSTFPATLDAALSAGDVASLLIRTDGDPDRLQAVAEALTPPAQARGVAVLLAGDSRIVGRARCDGAHVEGSLETLREALERFQPAQIVGAGGFTSRDAAMAAGEAGADYLLFGRLDREEEPAAHPKSLAFGDWWASVFEPPCVVMAGADLASIEDAADTGAEFVGVRTAIWSHGDGPAAAIHSANAILDRVAGRWALETDS